MDAATTLPVDADPCSFAEAVDRAEHDKARIALTRDGRPVAYLVPVEDAEALEVWEDAEDSRLAAEALADWEASGRPACITLEELSAKHGIDLSADVE